jgi:alkyl hydroperoxide reductase subunit AhpC
MKKVWLAILTVIAMTVVRGWAQPAEVGKAAPDFTLKSVQGEEHALAGYRGKFLVLEWTNYDCPFVRKHYESGNMQSLQRAFVEKGVIWLSICSSAPGKQGHLTSKEWTDRMAKWKVAATAVLVDADGVVGRAYGAKTTPHIFIVNPEGVLIYAGAIDDKPTADPSDIAGSRNYVRAALEEALAGKPVSVANTKPYGCSVKY